MLSITNHIYHNICKLTTTIAAVGLLFGSMTAAEKADSTSRSLLSRLQFGGYGEVAYTYNFYSDNVNRYSHAADYRDARGHGRFDIPHAVIMIGFDFGKGWSMGSEIEFEHGGVESAV